MSFLRRYTNTTFQNRTVSQTGGHPTHYNPQLPLIPRLSLYKGNSKDNQPEILIDGDSIIWPVILPGAFTYCLPRGGGSDVLELFPLPTDLHSSVHTLIFHMRTNDVRRRQSITLRDQLEPLAVTVQSTDIFFSPWSHPCSTKPFVLYILHEGLKSFCITTGKGFVSNFDYFRTRNWTI